MWAVPLTLLGMGLRIAGARGDLWFDEILSLYLVTLAASAFDILLISHDNNHLLNSLYLHSVGIYQPPIVLRGFSILLGTLSIPAAGVAAMGKSGSEGRAIVAMLLFAVAYPIVHFGSEARGYAGLILATLLAFHLVETQKDTVRNRAMLGVVVIFGVLS